MYTSKDISEMTKEEMIAEIKKPRDERGYLPKELYEQHFRKEPSMQELEKNIYELRGVAGIIGNLDSESQTTEYFDNMMFVLATKLYSIADSIELVDEKIGIESMTAEQNEK